MLYRYVGLNLSLVDALSGFESESSAITNAYKRYPCSWRQCAGLVAKDQLSADHCVPCSGAAAGVHSPFQMLMMSLETNMRLSDKLELHERYFSRTVVASLVHNFFLLCHEFGKRDASAMFHPLMDAPQGVSSDAVARGGWKEMPPQVYPVLQAVMLHLEEMHAQSA